MLFEHIRSTKNCIRRLAVRDRHVAATIVELQCYVVRIGSPFRAGESLLLQPL